MAELSVDKIGNAAVTDYDDLSGLASFTDYVALDEDQNIAAAEYQDDFVDEANITVPYSKQPRGYGEGDKRLGTSLSLEENIYSLAYVAQLDNYTIDKVTERENSERPTCI